MYVYIFILVSLLCFKHTAAHTYFVDQEVFFFLCAHNIPYKLYSFTNMYIYIYISIYETYINIYIYTYIVFFLFFNLVK